VTVGYFPAPEAACLAGAADTDDAFSLLLSRAPAGDGAPPHTHAHESESFFALAGTYRIECGGADQVQAVPTAQQGMATHCHRPS
jgi:mannose-6-phosphate isomerase-like protein (cupin superfamily)